MENNEIMERLLQDEKETKPTVNEKATKGKSDRNGDSQISRIRIVSAKYKVYIVLLLIFICLLGLTYIPRENNSLKINDAAYDQARNRLSSVKREIDDAKKDMNYLSDIINNENNLKNCLNSDKDCSSLPEGWATVSGDKVNLTSLVPLSYLQTNSLYNKKMPVDEKVVLKNLNEYLIKQDILLGDRSKVGDILRINIGDPEAVNGGNNHFFQVPVDVEIKFSTVNELVGFLYNVEKKLIDKGEDRILYKIQSVSYDVISRDEPQVTDISMIAYYYHDDRFADRAEYDESANLEIDNTTDSSERNEENIEDKNSDSIFSKIFGK